MMAILGILLPIFLKIKKLHLSNFTGVQKFPYLNMLNIKLSFKMKKKKKKSILSWQ